MAHRTPIRPAALVFDADDDRAYLRGPELLAQAVELAQVRDRAEADAVPDVLIDRHALHVGAEVLPRQLRLDAVGISAQARLNRGGSLTDLGAQGGPELLAATAAELPPDAAINPNYDPMTLFDAWRR
jgi:hypothetical protein